MKKIIVGLLAGLMFVTSMAQTISAKANSTRGDTVVTASNKVTYVGMYATDSRTNSIVYEGSNMWKIMRFEYTTNGVFVSGKNAYGTARTADLALWANAWTNRYNATYK